MSKPSVTAQLQDTVTGTYKLGCCSQDGAQSRQWMCSDTCEYCYLAHLRSQCSHVLGQTQWGHSSFHLAAVKFDESLLCQRYLLLEVPSKQKFMANSTNRQTALTSNWHCQCMFEDHLCCAWVVPAHSTSDSKAGTNSTS